METKENTKKELPVLGGLIKELGHKIRYDRNCLFVRCGGKGKEEVCVKVGYGRFLATDRIPGIPMKKRKTLFGHGEMHYMIVI